MSKLLRHTVLIGLLSIVSLGASAQREIDLSVVDIIGPDTIFEGAAPYIEFTVQNLGPSYIIPGDTIMFRVGFEDNHQTTGFFNYFPQRALYALDTIHIGIQYPIAFNWPGASYRSNICALAILFNRSENNPVVSESGDDVMNNELCVDINYINEDGWGVEVAEKKETEISISPNPSHGIVRLNGLPQEHGALILELRDPMGRTVQEFAPQIGTSVEIPTHNMTPGLYYCHIKGADFELIRKLWVLN